MKRASVVGGAETFKIRPNPGQVADQTEGSLVQHVDMARILIDTSDSACSEGAQVSREAFCAAFETE